MSDPAKLNLDEEETGRFEESAATWWDPDGPMRPLHDLNPARLGYVTERCEVRNKDILDVGCGGGILSESLAGKGANVTGIDAAERVIQVARLHLQESRLNVNYRAATAEELAGESRHSFDAVTCMEMLEHVPEPASVVRSIAAMLKPGGDAFFSTLNRTPLAFLLGIVGAEYVARFCPRGTHRYDRFIRPSELSTWLRSSGLQVLDISGIHYNPMSKSVMVGGHVHMNYLLHARKPTTEKQGEGVQGEERLRRPSG